MYSSFPKSDRILIRLALSAAWAFTSIAGFVGVLVDLGSIEDAIGHWTPFVGSLVVGVFGLFAALGVALDRYWIEWAAAWFVSGGVLLYTVVFWALVFTGNTGRFQTAALLSALLCFYSYRIISCAAHARKQRQIHKLIQSGELRLPHA